MMSYKTPNFNKCPFWYTAVNMITCWMCLVMWSSKLQLIGGVDPIMDQCNGLPRVSMPSSW